MMNNGFGMMGQPNMMMNTMNMNNFGQPNKYE